MNDNPYGPKQHRAMAEQYLRQQIEQANSIQQVLMLFDGIVKFTQQAKEAIERKDIQARHNANRRAIEIVAYLIDMIDVAKEGDAGKRLHHIYTGLLGKLVEVDFKNDVAVCDEIISHFKTLRARFTESAQQAQAAASKPASQPVTPLEPEKHAQPGSRRNAVA